METEESVQLAGIAAELTGLKRLAGVQTTLLARLVDATELQAVTATLSMMLTTRDREGVQYSEIGARQVEALDRVRSAIVEKITAEE